MVISTCSFILVYEFLVLQYLNYLEKYITCCEHLLLLFPRKLYQNVLKNIETMSHHEILRFMSWGFINATAIPSWMQSERVNSMASSCHKNTSVQYTVNFDLNNLIHCLQYFASSLEYWTVFSSKIERISTNEEEYS